MGACGGRGVPPLLYCCWVSSSRSFNSVCGIVSCRPNPPRWLRRPRRVYKQAFPEGRIVNPRAQMEQQLKASRQQSGVGVDFLALVAKLGGVFAATPGVELTAANFREGALDIELTAADVQVLDHSNGRIERERRFECGNPVGDHWRGSTRAGTPADQGADS